MMIKAITKCVGCGEVTEIFVIVHLEGVKEDTIMKLRAEIGEKVESEKGK